MGPKEDTSDTFTKKFQLRDFKPDNIQIRVTKDKRVVIEAKEEIKEGKDGYQSYQLREFKKTVEVPENVNIEELTSSFSEQGLVTISAPLLALPQPKEKQETILPVTFDSKEKNDEKNDDTPSTETDSNSVNYHKED